MKALILNGSPNVNGDTAFIVNKVKDKFPSDTVFEEINAYKDNIEPCIDCRYCWKNKGCAINDKMSLILKDDYDVVLIASPIYISFVTPPLFSIYTRLNFIWSNKHFLNITNDFKKKKGIIVFVGGGDGAPDNALSISMRTLRKLNADFDIEKDFIHSLNTNTISVQDDKTIDDQINTAINHILSK